jgi:hypothetical protein
MNTNSNTYTIIYASVMVIIVAFLLAFVSDVLKDKQTENVELDKKKQILLLRSGDELKPVVNKFGNIQLELPDGRPICILSKACRERLLMLFENGYELSNAKIDYIAAWKSEEVGEETAIILPSVYLKKR